MEKVKIQIEISSCQKCLHFIERPYPTADSWERAHNWHCSKMHNKKIAGYVEWHDEDKIGIPEWCPIRVI